MKKGALKQYGTVVNFVRQDQGDLVDWVIGNFTQSQRKVVDEAIGKALDAAACVIEHGVSEAQNRFN